MCVFVVGGGCVCEVGGGCVCTWWVKGVCGCGGKVCVRGSVCERQK